MADTQPYGDVSYADPGYQKDKVKRYPLDTKAHVTAAWSYINMPKNASQYSSANLASVKSKIRAAAKRFGITIADAGRTLEEQMTTEVERRYTELPVEVRTNGERRSIGGYAAKFGRFSQNLGGYVERIDPNFFNKSKGDGYPDVVARYNHRDDFLLGSTQGRTLRLQVDAQGLSYEVDPPQSRADVLELVQRGDVSKSSFAFDKAESEWALTDQGFPMRTLMTGRLIDVAPCHAGIAAYPDTTVGLRSLAEHFSADLEEVRTLAAQNELRRFFVRTDGGAPATKRMLGAAALIALKSRPDPLEGLD
ncbi:MAG TPA: HK97 family phage prohead protease [Candidatus Limnocylindria bacterium]|nr:HK97 family phage prohead protease [Candidatus Limnocylindria bacterium]